MCIVVIIDWLIDWLIGWLVGWLLGWLIDWFDWFDWLVGWLVGWLVDGLVGWVGWLVGWLIDWLVDWLIVIIFTFSFLSLSSSSSGFIDYCVYLSVFWSVLVLIDDYYYHYPSASNHPSSIWLWLLLFIRVIDGWSFSMVDWLFNITVSILILISY